MIKVRVVQYRVHVQLTPLYNFLGGFPVLIQHSCLRAPYTENIQRYCQIEILNYKGDNFSNDEHYLSFKRRSKHVSSTYQSLHENP